MLKLQWPAVPSPMWFNSNCGMHVGVVRADGRIDAEGNVLLVLEGDAPAAGTELRIETFGHYLKAELVPEYNVRISRQEADRDAAARKHRDDVVRRNADKQRQQVDRAAAVNAQLNVPVRWTSGLKTVLSGLSAGSGGAGENARSVNHILLLEPVVEGRFRRAGHTFLCTPDGGAVGQAWTGRLDTHSTGTNGAYVNQITCKQCITLAQRWKDAGAGRIEPELVKP